MADFKIIESSSGDLVFAFAEDLKTGADLVDIALHLLLVGHGVSAHEQVVVHGELLKNAAAISQVPADCAPGSFAYTADFSYIAQKGLDGEWHEIGGTSNG